MGGQTLSKTLFLGLILCSIYLKSTSSEVCSNSFLPGSKGDPGDVGEEGKEGTKGKTGPPGKQGLSGDYGEKGMIGQIGKMGPKGKSGDKGQQGADGHQGPMGKPGMTCDCGKYRKVIGQMDINLNKLKKAITFLKKVVLDIRETENMFYLLVTEARTFQESLLNCKSRGGSLAKPRVKEINTLLASYIREADLTHVYIGLEVNDAGYVFVDSNPFFNATEWEIPWPETGKGECVKLSRTGGLSQVDCDNKHYFICEFMKNTN